MTAREGKTERRKPDRVSDIVARHRDRQLPLVTRDTPIEKLSEAIKWYRHSRQLYVVDEDNRLLGNITLDRLVMYVFASSHGASMNPRTIMGLITCQTAGDLMTAGTFSAKMKDKVEKVLELMVSGHMDEVPITDEEGKVVGDLTLIDLLLAEQTVPRTSEETAVD